MMANSCLKGWIRQWGPRAGALFLSIGITLLVVLFRDRLVDLKMYGYAGVFFIALLGNATVIFPVPGLAVVFASGGVLNPLFVGLVAGIAEPIGELTGYLAGYAGNAIIQNSERFLRVRAWMERRGFWTLFALSAIPNPFFDLAGIAAGMLRFPLWRFLIACWLGKTAKGLIFAYLGAVSIEWLSQWLKGF